MKKWILFLLAMAILPFSSCISTPRGAAAGSREAGFARIDGLVASMPRYPTIGKTAARLAAVSRGEWEKARAVYDWVCLNISYDTAALRSGKLPDPSADSAFARGKAVCEGFAELGMRLAREAGLEAVLVPGYSKGYGFAQGRQPLKPDHIWNAFRIEGKWHLMDMTWGAGHIDDSGNFRQDFSHAWFAMDPELFCRTHYPDNPAWLPSGTRMSLADFGRAPFIQPYVFRIMHDRGYSREEQEKLLDLLGSSLNANIRNVASLREKGFPLADQALLAANAEKCGVGGEFFFNLTNLVDFGFGTGDLMSFMKEGKAPRAYAFDAVLRIVDVPKTAVLKAGKTYRFAVRIDGAGKAAILCGKSMFPMDRAGNLFSATLAVREGPVKIAAALQGGKESTYLTAFSYEVAD